MQRLEVSGAVRPIYGSLGVKWLICDLQTFKWNILPPTWGFQEAVLCHDLKDHSLNTDVKHFYKIPAFLIQKNSFLKRTYLQVWKNSVLTNIKFRYVVIVIYILFYDVY